MANVTQVVPFLWVRDLDASLRFYRDGLSFAVKNQWLDGGKVRWCWLELGGTALMLQERSPEKSQSGDGVTLYFICLDALLIYRELRSRGIEAKRPFVGNGFWVTELDDPDGYHIAFESPTDAPEESEYPA